MQNAGIVGAAWTHGAEVGVAERPALAVGGKIQQVAVGPEVAVGVVPRSRGGGDDALRRIEPVAENHVRVVAAKRLPLDVRVGDTILYGKYAGTEVKWNGEDLKILRESEILAVVEEK